MQRMVVSLSSDENVWNAVMNNELVRKLRASLGSGLFTVLYFHSVIMLVILSQVVI